MAEVRFKLDHHQLTVACDVMAVLLREEPRGEFGNMMHSLAERLHVRLSKRLPEKRLEFQLNLPVHDALAIRRMLLSALEWGVPEHAERHIRSILGVIDPLTTLYTVVR